MRGRHHGPLRVTIRRRPGRPADAGRDLGRCCCRRPRRRRLAAKPADSNPPRNEARDPSWLKRTLAGLRPLRGQGPHPAHPHLLRGHRSFRRRLSRQLSALHGAGPLRVFPLRRHLKLAMLEDAEPTAWTLRKVSLEYFRPARVDDLIEVHTTLHRAHRRADGGRPEDLRCRRTSRCRERSRPASSRWSGRPRRIPQEVRDNLAPLRL